MYLFRLCSLPWVRTRTANSIAGGIHGFICPSLAVCKLPKTISEPVQRGLQGKVHLPLRAILLDYWTACGGRFFQGRQHGCIHRCISNKWHLVPYLKVSAGRNVSQTHPDLGYNCMLIYWRIKYAVRTRQYYLIQYQFTLGLITVRLLSPSSLQEPRTSKILGCWNFRACDPINKIYS